MNTSPPADALRIILVDDDRTLSLYHAALLEDAGFAVRHALKPSLALEMFSGFDPDLLIVDFHLPEMTGPEFASRVRDSLAGEEAAILLITADEHRDTLVDALNQGISSFLYKPLNAEIFIAISRSLAGNSRKLKDSKRRLLEMNQALAEREMRYRQMFEGNALSPTCTIPTPAASWTPMLRPWRFGGIRGRSCARCPWQPSTWRRPTFARKGSARSRKAPLGVSSGANG